MEKFKKLRGTYRRSFTKQFKELEALMKTEDIEIASILNKFKLIEETYEKMADYDEKILENMWENAEDSEMDTEQDTINEYKNYYFRIQQLVNQARAEKETPHNKDVDQNSRDDESFVTLKEKNYRLPKIELKKFNGELLEWLSFWSQFKKIHDDEQLHEVDKFYYLVQSIEPNTRARDVVDSFPHTEENYQKVVNALTERFGNQELLIEVYVRELLKMVINNVNRKEKVVISKMYDRLETHLRALESMKIKLKENSCWLYPLVESSLPDEVLRAWQRSYLSCDSDGKTETQLENLMKFLKNEVRGEERLNLAKNSFIEKTSKPFSDNKTTNVKKRYPTTAGLLNNEANLCIFCKKHHEAKDCVKAQSMSYAERKAKIQQNKSCFICLKYGHMSKSCTAIVKCMICGGKHSTIICEKLVNTKSKIQNSSDNATSDETAITASNLCIKDVILQTLVVNLIGDNTTKNVRALIDTGSQKSYILEKTAKELNLTAERKIQISQSLFGGHITTPRTHLIYNLTVKNLNNKGRLKVECINEKVICGDISHINNKAIFEELKKKKIYINDVGKNTPTIELLIGSDIYGKILTGKIIQLKCGLTAFETIFGWTLSGVCTNKENKKTLSMLTTSNLLNNMTIPDLWKLEAIGICDPVEKKNKLVQEEEIKKHFLNTVKRNDKGRYCVSLPWIEKKEELPSNRNVAEKRLKNMAKKLIENNLYQNYEEIFDEWLKDDIIEEVKVNNVNEGHFLPHRAVIKTGSLTTKIRPVFDASCKIKSYPSLNNCLHKGPNLIELIPSLILKFREGNVGVIADIKKAFLQIEVNENDRKFLRFLWYENKNMTHIKILQHKRVVFGVNCSPFLLAAVIEKHLLNVTPEYEDVATKLLKSFYVDNCITSVNDMSEYDDFKMKSTQLMNEAQMELRLWEFGPDPFLTENFESNILGLVWNKKEDSIKVKFDNFYKDNIISKRNILSIMHQIFDPIGFLSPILLVPKLLIQQSWDGKYSWDEELPEEYKVKFKKWLDDLTYLSKIAIPRRMSIGEKSNFSIHIFCDASKDAYATVIYLRSENNERVNVQLIAAKSRVTPKNKVTIPRLELLACLIGVRLLNETIEATNLKDTSRYFWTDSSTALAWIKNCDQWGTFVGNRTKEINKYSSVLEWRHIQGKLNPADLPSRGCTTLQLLESKWWEGPLWLKFSEREWPITESEPDITLVNSEKRKTVSTLKNIIVEKPFYYKFSKYSKVIRILCWIRRFINNCNKTNNKWSGNLTVEEYEKAEIIIFKLIQMETFPFIQDKIKNNFKTYKDEDGIVRVKTKLIYGDDPFCFKYPILLPTHHHMVHLLIHYYHKKYCHGGLSFLISKLREQFWVINSRKAIKNFLRTCVICKKLDSKAKSIPPPPLPKDRIADVNVFEIIGIDLAGPLFTRKNKKCWIVLFTCAVYRAVHLELVSTLGTDTFLMALRRFISRRGRPKVIYSDNGTNFVGINNCFKKLDWNKIQDICTTDKILWKFNPPAAPWWGGWWERLIRTVKSLLIRILGKSSLDYEEINTTLCDIESTINDRPLTYVSENNEELIAITPSKFLKEIYNSDVTDLDVIERYDFKKRYKYREKIKSELRQRFRKEYLGQLIAKYKEKTNNNTHQIGDVVLISNENKRRKDWCVGRITELIQGKDGLYRVAKLKTNNGELVRPILRLYPLEVAEPSELQIENTTRTGRLVIKPIRYR